MPTKDMVERIGDMHPHRALRLSVQSDGDVIVNIVQNGVLIRDCDAENEQQCSAQIEFCVSGGRSRYTLHALYALIEAMKKDAFERPICK